MEGGAKPLHRTRARPTVQRRSLTLTRESVRAKEPRMVRFPRMAAGTQARMNGDCRRRIAAVLVAPIPALAPFCLAPVFDIS
jgi:hypothetical protein